jgi:putative glutathione S-transferase
LAAFSHGWSFTGRDGTTPKDPIYGFTRPSELYFEANSEYDGRYTVPVLWDKKLETIIPNESSDIIRMLYEELDALLPKERREANKPNRGRLPRHLTDEIEEMNSWVYGTIKNGVYRAEFATTQEAYENAVKKLFASLDRVEGILSKSEGPYLFGKYITEADIRLYHTIARFDVAYYTLFMCHFWMDGWTMGISALRHHDPILKLLSQSAFYLS